MIDYQTFCRLRQLHDQEHLTVGQIARELSLDERTVSRWIHLNQYQPRAKVKRASKLDPFRGTIVRLLAQHDFSAEQLLHRLKEEGYTGGYSILKKFVALVRPKTQPAFLSLQFAPGQCAQVDWGSAGAIQIGSTRRRLSFFVMVLCFSRKLYLEFTLAETQEQFLSCHDHAFEYFLGIPQQLMVDNCKVAVLKHQHGQPPVFHPKYLDFARHCGIELRACNPRSPHEKGRVEKAVDYVKKNFLAGRTLDHFESLNAAARLWLDTVANVRQHRETGQTPQDLFAQEQARLHPLGSHRYDIATIRTVRASRCFRVVLDTNRYSVPATYAGRPLTLKIYPDKLLILHGANIIAEHVRSYDRRQDFEHPDHAKPLLDQRNRARQQRHLIRFLELGPAAQDYYQQLKERRSNPMEHVIRIIALSEIYGPQPVARALQDALSYQAFSAEYITNLLQQQQRPILEAGALHLSRASDLLQLELPAPDLSAYDANNTQPNDENNENQN